jgi:hypothetical protein
MYYRGENWVKVIVCQSNICPFAVENCLTPENHRNSRKLMVFGMLFELNWKASPRTLVVEL